MNTLLFRVLSWRRFWTAATLVLLLGLMLTTVVSANSLINEQLMWATICHTQPGQETAQTMVIYWSALDKCLSHFSDFMGPCP